MNEVDWVILAVLGISTIVGVSRGLVREILAIVGWVLAILLALRFAPIVDASLVVVATLLVIGLAGKIFAHLMAAASITFEDRAIGAIFGLLRGVVIVCACVFVLGLTSATKTGLWRNSVFIVPCEHVIDFCMPYLPQAIVDLRRRGSIGV